MRYLTLVEALVIAEVVTGLDSAALSRASRLELLDSALPAPQAGFGDTEFYPEFVHKAAVLAVRIARNHPLSDGNKRLAWQSLTVFCALNDRDLDVPPDEVVETMLAIAAGEWDEDTTAEWIRSKLTAGERDGPA